MLGVNARPAVGQGLVAPVVARPGPGRRHPRHGHDHRHARRGRRPRSFLIGTGELFWGAFAVTVFVLLDMLDGALARARGGGSVFGAVLDSAGDRAADAAIFGALVWWFSGAGDNRLLVLLALLCLVLGVLTSYIKARAEGVGLSCDVGIVERTERLILVLVGTGFTGLGHPVRAARRRCGCCSPAARSPSASGSSPSAAAAAGAALPASRRPPPATAAPARPGSPPRLTDAGFAAGWRAVRHAARAGRPRRRSTAPARWAAGRDGTGVAAAAGQPAGGHRRAG